MSEESVPQERPGGASFVLLGRFSARIDSTDIPGLTGRKLQELLSYLLLFRAKPHRREILADTLWGGISTAQSKKYLRQTLWQLHRILGDQQRSPDPFLLVNPDWIQINEQAGVWLDVAEVELAFEAARGREGEELDPELAAVLDRAIRLYRGELLEGWYQDWCVFERERLKAMYLTMVEKMLGYHELHRQVDEGLLCGERILRHDRAHERTHWRLMRLRYLAGDRTGAMRQYEACAAALREELDVAPSERTSTLYEQIRADEGMDRAPRAQLSRGDGARHSAGPDPQPPLHGESRPEASEPLEQALATLVHAERLVEESLRALQAE